jgi:DNA-binding CsgD family transcriptional regulator
VAAARRDAAVAEEQYRHLKSQSGTVLILLGTAADRLLALLALTMGRVETAHSHFEAALSFCDRSGYRAEYAQTALDYAVALLQREETEKHERAANLYSEALATARALEMTTLEERLLATPPPEHAPALLHISATAASTSARQGGLTARELEVLRFVAEGLTDAQVAEQLVVSLRTVHAHLRSIYRKLDVSTRSAATRYAIEHGIPDDTA